MEKKLRCLAEYRNAPRGLHYQAGQEIEVSETEAAYLMVDAPGCFEELVEPEPEPKPKPKPVKAVRKPPRNKAVGRPKEDK